MKLTVASSPHIRGNFRTNRIMMDVVLALLPALAVGLWKFGFRVIPVTTICIGAAIVSEWLYCLITKSRNTTLDGSAIVPGLLLAMVMVVMLLAGCGAKEDAASAERIAQLEQENAELQAQIEELTARIEGMNTKAALKDWSLDATVWSDSNGVTVAFTAVPDPVRGQVVKATIVLNKGFTASDELKKELQNHVKVTTAPYKYPRIIEFVTELPKTTSGKIKRAEIRKNDSQQ